MHIQIRQAVPSDAAALTELAHRAKSSWGYPADWIARWKGDLTLTPEYLGLHHGFAAVQDGKLVGICVLEDRGERWTLEHVWIAPEWHGRGIGRQLVACALETAGSIRPGTVQVTSDPFAEPFYVRLGARRIGGVPAPMPGEPLRLLPLLEFSV